VNAKSRSITARTHAVAFVTGRENDNISLTDIVRCRDAERMDYLIQNWWRNRNTIEFLGICEQPNNPEFNRIELDGIGRSAGLNSDILNLVLLHQRMASPARLKPLNKVARAQMHPLLSPPPVKRLSEAKTK
jgi:hypothetical protein